MAMDVQIIDNSGTFLQALTEQIEQALIAIGLTAESHAKENCPVDTGRLRNSITNVAETGESTVYIGTNVEYAAFVELGTSRSKAKPYLKPAVMEHKEEYKSLVEQALKG